MFDDLSKPVCSAQAACPIARWAAQSPDEVNCDGAYGDGAHGPIFLIEAGVDMETKTLMKLCGKSRLCPGFGYEGYCM